MQQENGARGQAAWMKTAYKKFLEEEGIPVYDTLAAVFDVTELPRKPWARTGGLGTYITMVSTTDAMRGIYVAEIPGGGALNPERHLFEEGIWILQGRGLTEVWQEGGAKTTFEWGPGSLFAPPLNTWHRLINGSKEPVVFLAVTTAPEAMEPFHNTEFIFNSDFNFTDRYGGQSDFFNPTETRYKEHTQGGRVWETHFIPDVSEAFIEDHGGGKVTGGSGMGYRMGTNFPNGHIGQWPAGVYHKAHWHGPGAILIGLKAKGYVLLWHKDLGPHPYTDGHEDQVMKVEWGPRSIYTPPQNWYHAHFNTGSEPARHIAVYRSLTQRGSYVEGDNFRILMSSREGGNVLDYEDEDPQIRQRFIEDLKKEGVECVMPPVTYR